MKISSFFFFFYKWPLLPLLLAVFQQRWNPFHTELMDTKAARPFSFSFNTSDYRILLMDQDQGRLYLGSREYLVALDMHNVNKEPLIVRRNSTSQLAVS